MKDVHVLLSAQGVASVWTVRSTPGMVYFRVPDVNDQTGWKVVVLTIEGFEALDNLFFAVNRLKTDAPGEWADCFRPGTVLVPA